MALFATHINSSALIAGGSATVLSAAGVVQPAEAILLFVLGTLGGILPDLDADHSTALQVGFNIASVITAFLIMLAMVDSLSVVELALLWLGIYLLLRLVVIRLFMFATVHRGIFHSLPAVILFGQIAIALLHYGFQLTTTLAWLGGLFVTTGALWHLLLDELTSLNLFGTGGVKSSLGSALKLYAKSIPATLVVYLAIAGIHLLIPPWQEALTPIREPLQTTLDEQLFPEEGKWF